MTFIIGTGSVVRLRAAEVAVERDARVGRRGRLRGRQRHAEDRVRARAGPCSRVPSSSISARVERRLVGGVEADQRGGDLVVHVRRPPSHALAAVPLRVAVAQLDGLDDAGRGAGRDGGAPDRARLELDVDLDGRVAARVEDLRALHGGDLRSFVALLGEVEVPVLLVERQRRELARRRRRESLRPLHPRREALGSHARRASSGSTFSRRATFTAAKSTSPSLLDTCVRRLGLGAGSARLVERRLELARPRRARSASAPALSGYSKPIAAARRCSFRA